MSEKSFYLYLAHMSATDLEQKYIKDAFETNWGLFSE